MFSSRHGINRLHFLLQQFGVLLLVWIVYPAINFSIYDGSLPSRDYIDASIVLFAAALAVTGHFKTSHERTVQNRPI